MSQRLVGCLALLTLAGACAGGTERAVNELIEEVRLGDPQAQVTYQQNQELVESPEAVPLWIDALENAPEPAVKEWAARILGNIGDPQAAAALTAALDGPREVREAAGDSLLRLGEEVAEEAFIEALQTCGRDCQIYCLVELEKLSSTGAIPVIAEVARSAEPLVAETAVTSLGGIGGGAAIEPLTGIAADPSVPEQVRRAAISSLGRVGTDEAVDALRNLVRQLDEQEDAAELRELAERTLREERGP